jgi:hypothetical protein
VQSARPAGTRFSSDGPVPPDVVAVRPYESDPAVMLGFVTLVVACMLLAAIAAALLVLAG